jgi:hypothetical protein
MIIEYFLGSLVTLVSIIMFNKFTNKLTQSNIPIPKFSQSIKAELFKSYLINVISPKPSKKTQSTEHLKKNSKKAFFIGKDVYWIEDGFLQTAKIFDNQIDETTKKKVDTHSLDKVELDKMIFIVDKLTEGNKDDSGNSGK